MATTLDNLIAAFNGESNANAKYTAFAQKADAEGFAGVASLFRAAAAAEAIHAAAHLRVIKSLGGSAVADIHPADVKSTAENLKAAIDGESYERDVMYPDFIKVATAEGKKNAVQSFEGAMAAEAEHARMYAQALADLANRKVKRDYWVCSVCGFTLDNAPTARCPVCNAPAEKFNKIN